MKATVIGTGILGVRIATELAMQGWNITLYEPIWEGSLNPIEIRLRRLLEELGDQGYYSDKEVEDGLGKINITTGNLKEAVEDADLVSEAIIEDLAIKQNILKFVSAYVREDSIITTNTINLSLDNIASHLRNPERFMGARFLYPVLLMNEVEITKASCTTQETISKFNQYMADLNKLTFFRDVLDDSGTRRFLTEEQISDQMERMIVSADDRLRPETESSQELGNCCVCLSRKKDTLIRPCSHLSTCYRCAQILVSRGNNCPICRGDITETIRVYIA